MVTAIHAQRKPGVPAFSGWIWAPPPSASIQFFSVIRDIVMWMTDTVMLDASPWFQVHVKLASQAKMQSDFSLDLP